MNPRPILIGLAALLVASAAHAVNDKIELMPGGVICDRGDQVCYDQRGANVSKTREMFGQYAADTVQKKLGKKDEWGTKKFTLSNGAKCSIPNRVCKHDQGEGERAKKITKHLFEAPVPAPR
jgi:hypothetical protein